MRSTSFAGTGSARGKRTVPLLTSYAANWEPSAARTRSVTGYRDQCCFQPAKYTTYCPSTLYVGIW